MDETPRRRFGRFQQSRKPRDRGGSGHEIVREITVCENCARLHADKQEAMISAAVAQSRAARAASNEEDFDDDDNN